MVLFRSVRPVLNVRDVRTSMLWFARLGFEPEFADDDTTPHYGGVRRDNVEVHLQWHSADEWADGLQGCVYRFLVDDPDQLFVELSENLETLDGHPPTTTSWGTREFGLFDPDRNALFFSRDL